MQRSSNRGDPLRATPCTSEALSRGTPAQTVADPRMRRTGVLRQCARSDRYGQQKAHFDPSDGRAKEASIVAWIYVLAAGLLEVVWAVGLKYTDGFTRLWPSMVTVVTFSVSLFL